ncbi:DUF2336 domain-containing protein [Rhizobium oryzicola]|uniref:DUF2336 domain-containing protein n=1 Tax=Rhizobium oryzicola TaxID=1232668 RepID=A0ABT8SZ08_9HYPH|nr:DUF2336 domain-containing protein [Rhizobium oryzicola]MDO1583710.1 DUF2336 domain-containing protein [Rhizobium oryzicola]
MILDSFIRWTENAKASDRAKAANALVRAYLELPEQDDRRRQAVHAMLYLLDDPSPAVRQVLADQLAYSPIAPRALMLALAEDQPEISGPVLTLSPVLSDSDLVELGGRGSSVTRALIAARPFLTSGAAAAIAEVGEVEEVQFLLENRSAQLTRYSLRRLAERHGEDRAIRNLLLEREDLPADARVMLVQRVTDALASSPLVRTTMSATRIAYMTQTASDAATLMLAGTTPPSELSVLIDHLCTTARMTPVLLLHALCTGRIEFFVCAITSLSSLEERRVRSLLATGRFHAVRALLEASGLGRDVAEIFCQAIFLWRDMARGAQDAETADICGELLSRVARPDDPFSPVSEVLAKLEELHRMEHRRHVRAMSNSTALAVA